MIDSIASAPAPVDNTAGVKAMSRLADRLLAVAPPAVTAGPASPSVPRFSPAVTAALSRSAAMSAEAERCARRSRWIILVEGFVSACSFIPYALVALGLRLTMARVFFLDGQTRVDGPRVPLTVQGFDLSVVLPLHVKAETFTAFLVGYAEFILPICLVLGLGTRFIALGLLIMTVMIQIYVMPQALWSVHVYWAAMLMVLLSLGAGKISADHLIRFVTRR